MGLQKHSKVLNDTVEMLSDEGSYHQLFHAYRDEEALPSGEVLKEIVDLCRAILFPGYYGNARISKQTIRFHTGVNVGTLHTLLSKQIYAGLCFADTACVSCPEEKILTEAEKLSEAFIRTLPEMRALLATDAEAAFNGDPAAQNINEVIFCYPGFRAVCNYRIAHQLYRLGVPFIPRMITEMAHSETGIDIHPGRRSDTISRLTTGQEPLSVRPVLSGTTSVSSKESVWQERNCRLTKTGMRYAVCRVIRCWAIM